MNYAEPDTKTGMTPEEQLQGIGELNRENCRIQYESYHALMSEQSSAALSLSEDRISLQNHCRISWKIYLMKKFCHH